MLIGESQYGNYEVFFVTEPTGFTRHGKVFGLNEKQARECARELFGKGIWIKEVRYVQPS